MTIEKTTELEAYRKTKDIVDTINKEKSAMIERGRRRWEEAKKRKDYDEINRAQNLVSEFTSLVDTQYREFRNLMINTYGNNEQSSKIAPDNPEPFIMELGMAVAGSEEIEGKLQAISRYFSKMKDKYRK